MRRSLAFLALLLGVAGAGALTSCTSDDKTPAAPDPAAPGGTSNIPRTSVFQIEVNGRMVWCVWAEGQYDPRAGGVSCDFSPAPR